MAVDFAEIRHGVGLFQGDIPEHVLRFIAETASRDEFASGNVVFHEKSIEDKVLILKKGICQLRRKDVKDKQRHQAFRYPGEQLGLSLAIAGPGNVRARHDSSTYAVTKCEVLVLRRDDLLLAMQSSHVIIQNAILSLANRFNSYAERQQWPELGPKGCLAAFLIDWDRAWREHKKATRDDTSYAIAGLKWSPGRIAEWTNMSEESASRSISALEDELLVSCQGLTVIRVLSKKLHEEYCGDFNFPSGI